MATPPFLPNEALPGASDLVSLFPAVEQTFRDVIEDWILWEHNTGGTHKQVTLDDISTPTIPSNLVGIWQESGVMKTRLAGGTVYDMLTSNTGLALAGGTMTGDLVLAGVPDADLKAATKKYVDDTDVLKANIASPTFTGNPLAPTQTVGNDSTRLATTAFVQAASTFGNNLFHMREEKASGSGAGTFNSGAWRKRTLDDIPTNEISGASLSSSVITLPAGTYYITATGMGASCNAHKLRLRNTSDNSTTMTGPSDYQWDGDENQGTAFLKGRFTIGGAKNFELQHRCSSSGNFGKATNFGEVEVYAEVLIWKLS